MDKRPSAFHRRRPYVMAMVLGTALSAALSPSAAHARESPSTLRTVADLSRYCTVCWRNARLPADSWGDCTQEVLCRLLQTLPQDSWSRALKVESDEHREFVRAIDAVKKRTQRQKRWNSSALDMVADRQESRQRRLADERAAVHQAASEVLTPRQQQIMQLSFEGHSVQEIGHKLALTPERVSDEKYKAIRKLRSHLAENA
jgi:RNA polymerase sigma factor (sigma-70 family)